MRTYWQRRMDYVGRDFGWTPRLGQIDPAQMDPGQQAVFQETGIYPDQQMAVETANELAQYADDQILQAYNTVLSTLQSEQADLDQMNQWYAANGDTLTPDGKNLYTQAVNQESDVVNNLQAMVSKFSAALQSVGLNASGLSGVRRRSRLGAFPVIVGVVISIISIVIGVSVWAYYKAQSEQAHADAEQAKTMTAMVTAGWTPAQIRAYQDSNKKSPFDLAKIPWTMILVTGGAVLVAKYVFE